MKDSVLAPVRAQRRLQREEDVDAREQQQVQKGHTSVMVQEAVELLVPSSTDVILDATAGLGGHSEALLKAGAGRVVALDADPMAVKAARERLEKFGKRALVIESNFVDCKVALQGAGVRNISKALFDLGWNMTQLTAGRGFSFMQNEPLHMGYGQKPASGFTAEEILNNWDEKVIADILFGYGEERYARRIARGVVAARDASPIKTTGELVAIIKSAVPASYRQARLHPATRSFQALRIAVNNELKAIEVGLRGAWEMLEPKGRIAVISFHSTEDRIVKRTFAGLVKEGGRLVVKKPLVASREEINSNPPSRSAKMRVIEKL